MKFLGSETREQIKQVEQLQAEIVNGLSSETAKTRLGEYAIRLLEIAQSIYVPNIKNRTVSAPKHYQDTDKVPLVVSAPNNLLLLHNNIFPVGPIQRKNLKPFVKEWFPADDNFAELVSDINAYQMVNKNQSRCAPTTKPGFGGVYSVNAYKVTAQKGEALPTILPMEILSKGIVVIRRVEGDFTPFSQEVTLAHELEHVAQFQEKPIMPIDENEGLDNELHNELEACHVAEVYGRSLLYQAGERKDFFDRSYSANSEVEYIRQDHEDIQDPFSPHTEARDALLKLTGLVAEPDLGDTLELSN